jgi:polyisoprenyl-phosphate glycosyltransferase
MSLISIVSPVYNSATTIEILVDRVKQAIKEIDCTCELILVDDSSDDNSWAIIEKLAKQDKDIKGLKLSRNFGQHYAIFAGLTFSRGFWTVVLDCDLQDDPNEIINLYNKAKEGYDIVLAKRNNRIDPYFKKIGSKLFYTILNYLTKDNYDASISNFGIFKRNVIDTVLKLTESNKYFPSMIKWVGYKSTTIDVSHHKSMNVRSTYNLEKLFKLTLDIILFYSDKPIRLLIKLGFSISFIAILVTIYFFLKWLNNEIIISGFTSLIISIWFLSGVIIFTLGIIGLYIGKTFEGVKARPPFIISDKTF